MADSLYGARVSMEPICLELVLQSPEQGTRHVIRQDVHSTREDGLARVDASFDGEVVEVAVTPHVPLTVESFRVTLRHAFAGDEMVLLNGYQSWTDTIERPAWSRMRGLRGVPKRIVGHWALHGGGDYAAVDYTARRGEQHGFTYATFRRGEGMVLVGSLDESHGFTLIRTAAGAGEVLLETEPPMRVLAAGRRVALGSFAITRGTEAECYDRYFELSDWRMRPVKPLVGYTSWYRHYGAIDERRLLEDLAGMKTCRCNRAGVTELFQIDDGYCKVGDWLDVDGSKFPRGLAPLADRILENGFLPGLWVAPYLCERNSRIFEVHPDWLLRDESGDPVPTGCQWSTGYALDTLNVDVRSYVLEVLQTMTREWGFGLLKADFLYAACMVPHGGMNRGELMDDAMRLLRAGVEGSGALILGCGVPLGSAFGTVDYCRIGCDVGLDWDDLPPMRLLHRERVSTKNSLGNTYGRAPLDGRAFGNDPDVFFLRSDVKLTDAQRDELLFADADSGSVFLTSDDMGQWTHAMRMRYEQALAVFLERHGLAGDAR